MIRMLYDEIIRPVCVILFGILISIISLIILMQLVIVGSTFLELTHAATMIVILFIAPMTFMMLYGAGEFVIDWVNSE